MVSKNTKYFSKRDTSDFRGRHGIRYVKPKKKEEDINQKKYCIVCFFYLVEDMHFKIEEWSIDKTHQIDWIQ